jgi:APA family basic amino acid/polyamine antiporter
LLHLVGVLTLSVEILGESEAPSVFLYREATGAYFGFIAAIAIFSILNGALIQIIMGSRIFYGMAARGWLLEIFVNVGSRTQTLIFATVVIGFTVMVFISVNAEVIFFEHQIGDEGSEF